MVMMVMVMVMMVMGVVMVMSVLNGDNVVDGCCGDARKQAFGGQCSCAGVCVWV